MRKSVQGQAWSMIKTFSSAHLYQPLLHNPSPQSSVMDLMTVNILSALKLRLKQEQLIRLMHLRLKPWADSPALGWPRWQRFSLCAAHFLILWRASLSLFTPGPGEVPKESEQKLGTDAP